MKINLNKLINVHDIENINEDNKNFIQSEAIIKGAKKHYNQVGTARGFNTLSKCYIGDEHRTLIAAQDPNNLTNTTEIRSYSKKRKLKLNNIEQEYYKALLVFPKYNDITNFFDFMNYDLMDDIYLSMINELVDSFKRLQSLKETISKTIKDRNKINLLVELVKMKKEAEVNHFCLIEKHQNEFNFLSKKITTFFGEGVDITAILNAVTIYKNEVVKNKPHYVK